MILAQDYLLALILQLNQPLLAEVSAFKLIMIILLLFMHKAPATSASGRRGLVSISTYGLQLIPRLALILQILAGIPISSYPIPGIMRTLGSWAEILVGHFSLGIRAGSWGRLIPLLPT